MGDPVGPQARREYLARMRERYERAERAAKSRLLDEVCEVTGYHRKGVIRLLRRPAVRRVRPRGRPVRYGPTVVGPLRQIWGGGGLSVVGPAARVAAGRAVVGHAALEEISREVADRLRTMSPRQMDRALQPFKKASATSRCGTRPIRSR